MSSLSYRILITRRGRDKTASQEVIWWGTISAGLAGRVLRLLRMHSEETLRA